MSQLICNVKSVLSLINGPVASSDDCNSILEKSSNVLAAVVKEESITVDLANDAVRIIADVDDMTKKQTCNIDMLVRVWNFYLPLLKKYHTLWNPIALSTCVDHLLQYTFDGIVSVVNEVGVINTSQSLTQVPDVLRSKLPLLNFFFQRLFATIVYRGRDISPAKITSALLQLATLRGALSSINQAEIAAAKDKFDTLLLRSMGAVETSSNLCEDVLWTAYRTSVHEVCTKPADVCLTYQLPAPFMKHLLRGLLFQTVEYLKCLCDNPLRAVICVKDVLDSLLRLLSIVPMYPQLMPDTSYLQLFGHVSSLLHGIYVQLAQQPHTFSCANEALTFLFFAALKNSSKFDRLRSAVASVLTCIFVAKLSVAAQERAVCLLSILTKTVFRSCTDTDIMHTVCSFVLRMSVAMPRHGAALVDILKNGFGHCASRQVAVLDALCASCSENEMQKRIITELKNYISSRKIFYDESMATFWCYNDSNSCVVISSAIQKLYAIVKYIDVLIKNGSNDNSGLKSCSAERVHRAVLNMRPWSRGICLHRTSLTQNHKLQLLDCLNVIADMCCGRTYGDEITHLAMICACELLVCVVRVISSNDCGRLVFVLERLFNTAHSAPSSCVCAEWSYLLSSMVSFRSEISSIDVKKQVRNIVPAQMVPLIQARANQQICATNGARIEVGYESRVVQVLQQSALPPL